MPLHVSTRTCDRSDLAGQSFPEDRTPAVVVQADGLELGFQVLDLAGTGAELLVGGALADAG